MTCLFSHGFRESRLYVIGPMLLTRVDPDQKVTHFLSAFGFDLQGENGGSDALEPRLEKQRKKKTHDAHLALLLSLLFCPCLSRMQFEAPCMCVTRNYHLFGVAAFSASRFLLHIVVSMVRGNSLSSHLLLPIASRHWHVHWHSDLHPSESTLDCQDCLFYSRMRPPQGRPTSFMSRESPRRVDLRLVPRQSSAAVVRGGSFAGWPIVEGRWIFVSVSETLGDASNVQLESCDDITGDMRYPCHFGELEQTEDPCNASDVLKWIEQSQGALSGLIREGQVLHLNNNVINYSVSHHTWFGTCWSADTSCSQCHFLCSRDAL